MGCNSNRWRWLCQTYNTLDEPTRNKIINSFHRRSWSENGLTDDTNLYEAMTDLDIVIHGDDPDPPPKIYATDAGAAEYDEIMSYGNGI